jgi:hypothetical protein
MGILNGEALEYMALAAQKTNTVESLDKMFSSPQEFASEYELPLPSEIESQFNEVQAIRDTFTFSPEDPVNKEVLSFFNKVVIDGRYLHQWVENPQEVANDLNLSVSDSAISRIGEIQVSNLVDMDAVVSGAKVVQVGIVLVIVIAVFFYPGDLHVVERPLIADRATLDII